MKDHESIFWKIEKENLGRQFQEKVKPLLASGTIKHLSIFGLAPQPLLMELGRLLSDIPAAEVYQLHREPPDWIWLDHPTGFSFSINKPRNFHNVIALNLSLSATIDNSRITDILGSDISIWTMTIKNPSNDFMKSREQLRMFRQEFRLLLDKIKSVHGQNKEIHVFPAVPVSVALEIGRVWMPKADLPMVVYDQNNKVGSFIKTFKIINQ